jgi:hypothetical protein
MDQNGIEAAALAIAEAHDCHTVILYGSRVRGYAGLFEAAMRTDSAHDTVVALVHAVYGPLATGSGGPG